MFLDKKITEHIDFLRIFDAENSNKNKIFDTFLEKSSDVTKLRDSVINSEILEHYVLYFLQIIFIEEKFNSLEIHESFYWKDIITGEFYKSKSFIYEKLNISLKIIFILNKYLERNEESEQSEKFSYFYKLIFYFLETILKLIQQKNNILPTKIFQVSSKQLDISLEFLTALKSYFQYKYTLFSKINNMDSEEELDRCNLSYKLCHFLSKLMSDLKSLHNLYKNLFCTDFQKICKNLLVKCKEDLDYYSLNLNYYKALCYYKKDDIKLAFDTLKMAVNKISEIQNQKYVVLEKFKNIIEKINDLFKDLTIQNTLTISYNTTNEIFLNIETYESSYENIFETFLYKDIYYDFIPVKIEKIIETYLKEEFILHDDLIASTKFYKNQINKLKKKNYWILYSENYKIYFENLNILLKKENIVLEENKNSIKIGLSNINTNFLDATKKYKNYIEMNIKKYTNYDFIDEKYNNLQNIYLECQKVKDILLKVKHIKTYTVSTFNSIDSFQKLQSNEILKDIINLEKQITDLETNMIKSNKPDVVKYYHESIIYSNNPIKFEDKLNLNKKKMYENQISLEMIKERYKYVSDEIIKTIFFLKSKNIIDYHNTIKKTSKNLKKKIKMTDFVIKNINRLQKLITDFLNN
ncbi:hypothetical protein CWI36_0017p0020 [Hamiltosporidium magnivora]|uniref:Uncharacterized protein n=1 Tax=Hamiltosporidium magnivora TaxID=148818 RepID=A0A4Q9LMJ3_9MICR|nr:hypothetical protein CWI36_0017p0020 [Hamiltosporidium magnivora]